MLLVFCCWVENQLIYSTFKWTHTKNNKKKRKYFRTVDQFSVNVPDVSGLCRHRHYLPTPPRVRGHINTQTEERLPINFDLNTLYTYSKSRYLAALFQVIIRKKGSVVHMTNYRVNCTMSCRIDCPWRGQRMSPVKSADFSTRYYPLIQ